MNKYPNTLVVRNKHLKFNIGLDPATTEMLNEMQHQLVEFGMKKPSGSLMIRHALRQLYAGFSQSPTGFHVDQLIRLA